MEREMNVANFANGDHTKGKPKRPRRLRAGLASSSLKFACHLARRRLRPLIFHIF